MKSWDGLQKKIKEYGRDIYFSERNTISQNLVRIALSPFVLPYSIARSAHQTYRQFNQQSVSVPVISVGNLSVGGTGKTPFVSWLVGQLTDMDLNPGILKRGEGNSEGNVPKYHKTEKLRDLAMEFGDEAALLRYRYPDIPISVGKKRLELAIQLIENHSPDVIVLDDGFQYRQLSRDLDIVLLRESDLKNNWQLPAGPLREPLSALARADFVSVYGNGASRRIEEHGLWNFTVPEVIDHYYQFQGIYRNDTNVTDDYRDRGCNLVSSVARPESLEKYLDGVGFNIVNHIACADHADPTQAVREALSDREYVMVTLKEWVKLDTSLKKKVGLIKSRLTVEPKEVLLDGVKATVALERNCSR